MELGKEVYEVDDEIIEIFLKYPWPGNIRELEKYYGTGCCFSNGVTNYY
jgi:transcriptional regulator with PAS, ATPase and Fis domain